MLIDTFFTKAVLSTEKLINKLVNRAILPTETYIFYVEIKRQLDATDDFYCRSYCLLNMFRGTIMPIIRSSRV